MKHLLQNIIIILILTAVILTAYGILEDRFDPASVSEYWRFLTGESGEDSSDEKAGEEEDGLTRAVWISYLEFNAYQRSVEENTEEAFRAFYQRILNRCRKMNFNTLIVHVRPFGDALYASDSFPWAACISGTQGESPGYDPLKIMTEMTHAAGMEIEAWINPYRVSSGTDVRALSADNPARKWLESGDNDHVLSYDGALYYNPSSEEVRNLIVSGVKEIVENYDVDGVHMDDYFYPAFTEESVEKTFDAADYQAQIKSGAVSSGLSIADWRREQVNQLVSDIYQAVKEADDSIRFGISPAGNLANLRSDLEYYADVDTWVKEEGYVDYIMPQIYWGFTHSEAPFDKMEKEWEALTSESRVKLYIGIQLYRMGTADQTQSDYEELQKASLIQKQISYVEASAQADGYCLFSYQYLDVDCKKYKFDSREFSAARKKILRKVTKKLKEANDD